MIIQIEQISVCAFNGIKYRWYVYKDVLCFVTLRAMDYGYSYTLLEAKCAARRTIRELNRDATQTFKNIIVW